MVTRITVLANSMGGVAAQVPAHTIATMYQGRSASLRLELREIRTNRETDGTSERMRFKLIEVVPRRVMLHRSGTNVLAIQLHSVQ